MCYTGPERRTYAHTTAETLRARAFNTQLEASRDPIALKSQKVCARNMRHLKTFGRRPTSRPSKSIILSVTRVVSGATTHTRTEILHMLTLAPPKRRPGRWTPLHSKCAHNIRHVRERTHLLDEREQPLAHQNSSCRALHRSLVACSCTRPS